MKENVEPSHTRRGPDSAESTGGSRLFLFLSLSLNLGLLLFLPSLYRRSEPQVVATIPSTENTILPNAHTSGTGFKRPPASRWRQLESTDFAVYATNLHTAGCPPETVRDILLPLIEEKFVLPQTAVSEPTNFWASFSQRQAAAAARAKRENALTQEKDKVVKELLGFNWTSEGLKQGYEEAAGYVGFLDYEHAEKLLCITDRFEKQFMHADPSHSIDRRSAIYNAWREEAGKLLSPAEFEEAELRGILMTCQRRNSNLCKAGLNESELRQLMAFKRELCNPLPSALFAKSDEPPPEPNRIAEQQFNAKARSLLGDSRFIVYLKSCDTSIERTIGALEQEHLPRSLTLQLFDLHQDVMARAQQIRQLPVRRADKRAQLAALRQTTREQLGALPNVDDSLLIRINQDWLQEIAIP